jgi:hypothetical protein
MMDYSKRKGKAGHAGTILVAVVVVVVIASSIILYPRPPTSNTVYCGILQYIVFPARTIVRGQTINVTETITTAVDYTTTTTPGQVGQSYSNSTTTVGTNGYSAGVETICKYISITTSK